MITRREWSQNSLSNNNRSVTKILEVMIHRIMMAWVLVSLWEWVSQSLMQNIKALRRDQPIDYNHKKAFNQKSNHQAKGAYNSNNSPSQITSNTTRIMEQTFSKSSSNIMHSCLMMQGNLVLRMISRMNSRSWRIKSNSLVQRHLKVHYTKNQSSRGRRKLRTQSI